MAKLKKWDQRVLANGNGVKWQCHRSWFGFFVGSTQSDVLGAWGRKRNLIWMGTWKEGI